MPQDNTFATSTTSVPMSTSQDNDASNQGWSTSASADASLADTSPLNAPTQSSTSTTMATPDPTTDSITDTSSTSPDLLANSDSTTSQVPTTDPAPTSNSNATNDMPIISSANSEIYTEVAVKINDSNNVLIALSSDPSVDELSAAIGLSLYLDRIGKRATAIYSGTTPNALEFLKPEETFATTADTLQDFVIALNKEKADHLRYKIDGDYVKVYITPYRQRLSQDDLEFSYGDYNVDLVIALDVANGIDLDAALREHGRIMHDAVIVNVTTGNPGKFGEIEWSDKTASSVSEMIATLLYNFGGEDPIAKDEATAYLTGIVAATNRFANAKTTPATMRLCSKLMESGANQQLVSKNITPDVDNEIIGLPPKPQESEADEDVKHEEDPTKLDIEHDYETRGKQQSKESPILKKDEVNTEITKKEHTLLDDLKAAEQSLVQASAETVPDDNSATLEISSQSSPDGTPVIIAKATTPNSRTPIIESSDAGPTTSELPAVQSTVNEPTASNPITSESVASEISNAATNSTLEATDAATESSIPAPVSLGSTGNEQSSDSSITDKPELTVAPSASFNMNSVEDNDSSKYGQMLQDALDSINNMPAEPTSAIMSQPDVADNPAVANAPTVSTTPEINGVPEMNFMPTAGDGILPPPPAPPIGMPQDTSSLDTALPIAGAPTTPLGPQPAMQDQVYRPQVSDPGAFKIPGM